jgi:hypothetical protein
MANSVLGDRAEVTIHPERGHSLGEHVFFGPMDEVIANSIADELAKRSRACGVSTD